MSRFSSSSSSSKSSSRRYEPAEFVCECGAGTCYRISKTEANPGRRFLCCKGGCGWLRWADKPTCPRCERLVPELLQCIKQKEQISKIKDAEQQEVVDVEAHLYKEIGDVEEDGMSAKDLVAVQTVGAALEEKEIEALLFKDLKEMEDDKANYLIQEQGNDVGNDPLVEYDPEVLTNAWNFDICEYEDEICGFDPFEGEVDAYSDRSPEWIVDWK